MPQTYEISSAPVLQTWLGRLAAAGLVGAASLALAQAPAPTTSPVGAGPGAGPGAGCASARPAATTNPAAAASLPSHGRSAGAVEVSYVHGMTAPLANAWSRRGI